MLKYYFLLPLFFTFSLTANAQSVNWNLVNNDQKNSCYLNLGLDFGLTTHIGYHRKIDTQFPTYLSSDFSIPMGKDFTDDFKGQLGAQLYLFEKGHFIASSSLMATIQRFQSTFSKTVGMGGSFAVQYGYYKPKWFILLEGKYKQLFATHIKPLDLYNENYESAQQGWYKNTSKHWFTSLQVSKRIGNNYNIQLGMTMIIPTKKHQAPLIPYQLMLGVNKSF